MRRFLRWELVSAVIALLALGVPLAFSAREAQRAREAAELSLFTGLHQLVNESTAEVDFDELRRMVAADSYDGLSSEDTARFTAALNNMEYLSWMFNERFIGVNISSAKELWREPSRCFRDAAIAVWGEAKVRESLRELVRYTDGAKPCFGAGAPAD